MLLEWLTPVIQHPHPHPITPTTPHAHTHTHVHTHTHTYTKKSTTPVVHVGAVKLDDVAQLLQQCVAHGLDAKHTDDFDQVVAGGACMVHTREGQHLPQCIQKAFLKEAEQERTC
eukprot:1143188-Pelagomonas_calceolata.AAC.2